MEASYVFRGILVGASYYSELEPDGEIVAGDLVIEDGFADIR
jgi:hypothetical protein